MYLLLVVSVFAASCNSVLLNRAMLVRKKDIYRFNLLVSIVWCGILFVSNGCRVRLNTTVLMWGMAYGITQALFIFVKTGAMSNGSVSITTLIGNCSLLVSVFTSMVMWGERVTVLDLLGLFLLLFAIYLCTYQKSDSAYTRLWKYYAVFFFLLSAGVGLVFKAFGKAGLTPYCGDMMFVSSVIIIVCYGMMCVFDGTGQGDIGHGTKRFLLFSLSCGILSCLYNRLNIFLAGNIDAIIFFPAFNGGVVLLSALMGVTICRERLGKKSILGMALGIMAILLIGIF